MSTKRNDAKYSKLREEFAKTQAAKLETPKEETRYVDVPDTEIFEEQEVVQEQVAQEPVKPVSEILEEAETVSKKQANISIERYLALLMKHGLQISTAWLFKPYNAMTDIEATSTTIPTVRMFQRRIEKWLKVTLPLGRLDKQDKADVEEIVTAVGNYLIRISAQAIDRAVNRAMHKHPVNPNPSMQPMAQTRKPLTPHEMNVAAYQQKMAQDRPQRNSNELTLEQKQEMISAIAMNEGYI